MKTVSVDAALDDVESLMGGTLINADGEPTHVLLVEGAPRSGKTTFALQTLKKALERYGNDGAMMISSNRLTARDLNAKALQDVESSTNPRIVRTLSALAFSVLAAVRRELELVPPRLLNGAEQDAVLTDVLNVHKAHAAAGELCSTCRLLLDYFAAADSATPSGAADAANATGVTGAEGDATSVRTITEETFAQCLSQEFVSQLRDMLARINEVGAEHSDLGRILQRLDEQQIPVETKMRMRVQWQLAFRLRGEYAQAVSQRFPDEFRLDSSYLLREATQALAQRSAAMAGDGLPQLLVVDDVQDVTLAGMALLQALNRRGVLLVLVGCNDEAVQVFRGSYPEFLMLRALKNPVAQGQVSDVVAASAVDGERGLADLNLGRFHAAAVELEPCISEADVTYKDVIASRVSLAIGADEEGLGAGTARPGKLPDVRGALALKPLPQDDSLLEPSRINVEGSLYRSASNEADDTIRQIKDLHVSQPNVTWNDMAVIAHDNATVHALGMRLRNAGVPVRYSSITTSFAKDSTVQGLFALIRLGILRSRGYRETKELETERLRRKLSQQQMRNEIIQSAIKTYLASPLIDSLAGTKATDTGISVKPTEDNPQGSTLENTQGVMPENTPAVGDPSDGDDVHVGVTQTNDAMRAWEKARPVRIGAVRNSIQALLMVLLTIRQNQAEAQEQTEAQEQADGAVSQEARPVPGISLVTPSESLEPLLALYDDVATVDVVDEYDELCAQLVVGDTTVRDSIIKALRNIGKGSADVQAFCTLPTRIDAVAQAYQASHDPYEILWAAWQASGVADRWQQQAVELGSYGDAANDRLDMMMRLFDYARTGGEFDSIEDFMDQVRQMDVIADSLSKTGPNPDAVTLTTPAGACGRSWDYVWIPAVQQDVWPNLTVRNTMFATEDLTDIMLRGTLGVLGTQADSHRGRVASVLHSEEKGLLVAITRAAERLAVSAVWSDDTTPSDFLFTFMPELFPVSDDIAKVNFTQVSADSAPAASIPMLIERARNVIAKEAYEALESQKNAAETLGVGEQFDPMKVPGLSYEKLSPEARDAVRTLRYLASQGYADAMPDQWAFVYGRTERETSAGATGCDASSVANDGSNADRFQDDKSTGGESWSGTSADNSSGVPSISQVSLSPSMVDTLWDCPVCALLDRALGGPSATKINQSFGIIVHKVAQIATERGWDKPGFPNDELSRDERIAQITNRMQNEYNRLSEAMHVDNDPQSQYSARRKEITVHDTLQHIASYFVNVNSEGYAADAKYGPLIGKYDRVESEYPLHVQFSIRELLPFFQMMDVENLASVSVERFQLLLDILAGGFAPGLTPDTKVTLNARIDRLEVRNDVETGFPFYRIVDYKTGQQGHTGAENYSDLQLVCYQLALTMSQIHENGVDLPLIPIASAGLFDIEKNDAPSSFHAAENCAQPPLFVDMPYQDGDESGRVPCLNNSKDRLDSHSFGSSLRTSINNSAIDSIVRVVAVAQYEYDSIGEIPVELAFVLSSFENHTLGWWSLTMLSRIFYAASVAGTQGTVPAHEASRKHMRYCRHKRVCPACGGELTTVMGKEER